MSINWDIWSALVRQKNAIRGDKSEGRIDEETESRFLGPLHDAIDQIWPRISDEERIAHGLTVVCSVCKRPGACPEIDLNDGTAIPPLCGPCWRANIADIIDAQDNSQGSS